LRKAFRKATTNGLRNLLKLPYTLYKTAGRLNESSVYSEMEIFDDLRNQDDLRAVENFRFGALYCRPTQSRRLRLKVQQNFVLTRFDSTNAYVTNLRALLP
jgi:hypothetical protein